MTPDPSTEALVARAHRVCDWADLHGDELEYRVRTEEDARVIDDALLSAWDVLALAARLSQAEEALRAIAADDDLVAANEDAFSVYAFRRCQQIARAALAASSAGEPGDG